MYLNIASSSFQQSYLNKQRKDKFIMVFDIPIALKDSKSNITRSNNKLIPDSLQFSIYGVIIPDFTVPDIEVPYGGQTLKVSSMARPPYPKNVINFTVDNYFNNYWVIYKWLEMFNDERTGVFKNNSIRDNSYLKNYETTITIFGMDEYNNRNIQFNFYHAFPTLLGGIKYSDRDSGEIESTFEYTYHQFEAVLL
jgi:hypothetical protein